MVLLRSALAFAIAVASTTALADTPTLRAEATVRSDVVRLGDLVENVPVPFDRPIFRAPDLGHVGDVPAAAVVEAARRLGLDHVETGSVGSVSVRRDSRAITPQTMADTVRAMIEQQYGVEAGNLEVDIDPAIRTVHFEADVTAALRVRRLSWSPSNPRFEAELELPGSALAASRPLRISGSAVETAEVLVFTRNIRQGELVTESHVAVERRPRASLRLEGPALAAVIGQAARRSIRAGQPVEAGALEAPRLVTRNTPVTLAFEIPGMTLAVRARAMEDGALGEAIAVMNAQSNKVVQAVVTGPGRVSILDDTRQSIAN